MVEVFLGDRDCVSLSDPDMIFFLCCGKEVEVANDVTVEDY